MSNTIIVKVKQKKLFREEENNSSKKQLSQDQQNVTPFHEYLVFLFNLSPSKIYVAWHQGDALWFPV